jgi:hypothetical protein
MFIDKSIYLFEKNVSFVHIIGSIKLFKGNKGNGYWKLNTSILENQQYCKSIEKLITKYQHNFFISTSIT